LKRFYSQKRIIEKLSEINCTIITFKKEQLLSFNSFWKRFSKKNAIQWKRFKVFTKSYSFFDLEPLWSMQLKAITKITWAISLV